MCGRYVRKSDKQKIAEHFAVHGPSVPDFGPSWNVAPQTFQPIVRLNRDTGERELVLMRWGLIPYWAKDPGIGLRTINANEVDDRMIIDIENALMKLSDAISAAFLTNNARSEMTWEALA